MLRGPPPVARSGGVLMHFTVPCQVTFEPTELDSFVHVKRRECEQIKLSETVSAGISVS